MCKPSYNSVIECNKPKKTKKTTKNGLHCINHVSDYISI